MSKYFLLLIFMSQAAIADPVKCLLSHAMVTGASISSGLDGTSFADQLVSKFGTQKKLIREAYPGVAGEAMITYPSFNKGIKSASLVLALDFFYWDQFSCEEADWESRTIKTIDALFAKSAKKGIPLVVGTLIRGKEPFNKIRFESNCAEIINQKVKTACDENPKKCLLVDMGAFMKKMTEHFAPKIAALATTAEKTKFVKDHVTRDGIHPRTDAYGVMALELEQLLRTSKLECK